MRLSISTVIVNFQQQQQQHDDMELHGYVRSRHGRCIPSENHHTHQRQTNTTLTYECFESVVPMQPEASIRIRPQRVPFHRATY